MSGWRGRVFVVGCGLLLFLGGIAAVFWLAAPDRDRSITAPEAPTGPGLDQPQADQLATALSDDDPARVAGVLAQEAAAAYLEAPAPVVPPDATLELDASTFTVTGEVDAAVAGSLTAGATTTDLVLLLALEDGEWRVITSMTA